MNKAFLINPYDRTITEVSYNGYQGLKKLMDGVLLDMVRYDNDHIVFLDDEGMMRPDQKFFRIPSYPKPLAGKGIFTGMDDAGENIDPMLTIETVRASVTFVDTKVKDIVTSVKSFGSGAMLSTTEVIFDTETVAE